jgi:dienelactone hydrolase
MRHSAIFTAVLCTLATLTFGQNRVFDWAPANSETIPLEPASLHAGSIYYPAVGGGDMHVQIDSRYSVTVAMAWADEWNAAMRRPQAAANLSFLCVKEHVTSTIYGYNGYYVDLDDYNYYFREGFRRGYQDGYSSQYRYGRYYSNGSYSILDVILSQVLGFQSLR